MKKKANRLDAIKMIISSKEVGSQEELLQELNREGFDQHDSIIAGNGSQYFAEFIVVDIVSHTAGVTWAVLQNNACFCAILRIIIQ